MDRTIAARVSSAKKVIVARLVADGAASDYLFQRTDPSQLSEDTPPMSFPADPADRRMGARLALISVNNEIHYVAAISRELADDPVRRKFDFRGLTRLDRPLPSAALAAVLTKSQSAPLGPKGGAFTRRASAIVLGTLTEHQPTMTDLLDSLFMATDVIHDSKEFRTRTATTDALMFTGAGQELDEYEVSPKETDLMAREAAMFLDWKFALTDTVKVRRFEDGQGRVLKVMVVDHDKIETEIGPDLIYYHKQRRSFVLVQYKRMVLREGKISYRANHQLDKQLIAMGELYTRLETVAARDDSDYRLLNDPSFVKVCNQQTQDLSSRSMVSGLCMPRMQIERYLRKSRTLSYEIVHDSMTSTDFSRLVAIGLLGSTPIGSEVIREKIKEMYGNVVYSEFSDVSDRRPATRPRRNKRPLDRRKNDIPASSTAFDESVVNDPRIEREPSPASAPLDKVRPVYVQDSLF